MTALGSPGWAACREGYCYQQVKRVSLMLPAIAVILWCNLLAVLGNSYLKVIALVAPGKKATAR